jgi:hypothetical protein
MGYFFVLLYLYSYTSYSVNKSQLLYMQVGCFFNKKHQFKAVNNHINFVSKSSYKLMSHAKLATTVCRATEYRVTAVYMTLRLRVSLKVLAMVVL